MRSIRNNIEDIGGWRGEVSWGKLEWEMNHERLWTQKQTEGLGEVGVRGAWWWVLRRAHIAWSTGFGA